MSSFGGIQQASTALAASQYGLQIVSQNIANASTPGYTRQDVDLASVDPITGVPRRYAVGGGPGGVTVTGTSRLNDPVIDARARTEHARSAMTDTAAAQLSQIESVFPEPSDTGLGAQLDQFWGDWANVANNPGSTAPRGVLLQDANMVVSTLHAMSTSLSDVQASAAQSVQSDLGNANTAAASLADLNTQIRIAHNTGVTNNSLLDQRDMLLDKLSSLVGGVATFNADGTANVTVGADASGAGGVSLVDGTTSTAQTLKVGSAPGYAITAETGGATPVVTPLTLTGGSAAAGVTTLTTTLPGVQKQLDAVAQALADTVNQVQTGGADQNGTAGTNMFTNSVNGSTTVTATTIQVAFNQPALVAAAAGSTVGTPTKDGSNALAASQLGASATAPDAVYGALVGSVGAQSSLAQQQQTTQDAMTASVDALRQSASGVSMDEEVSHMLTLQHAYQASSRVLTTLDDMLDTLINHTGEVGQA